MEDSNSNATAKTPADTAEGQQNPSTNNQPDGGGDAAANRRRRTPFTDLSQVDADLALARTLQEQERAYMMLTMGAGDGIPYGSWGDESFELGGEIYDDDDYDDANEEDYDGSDVEVDDEEDAFDVHAHEGIENGSQSGELDPSSFSSDEAYARALQDAEEREMAARMLALSGISEMVVGQDEDEDEDEDVEEDVDEEEEHGGSHRDTWEEVDPDELSYEELIALGEVVGTESRGLSADTIASLASIDYKSQGIQEGKNDCCVICRLDYEDGDKLTVLSCKHAYHPECINNWLQINKVCPVCSTEVQVSTPSASGKN